MPVPVTGTGLPKPIPDIAAFLEDPGMESIKYIKDIEALTSQPIAVLAAQIGEDRTQFMKLLEDNGVATLAERQLFTNSLAKAVRLGRITRGWAKAPEPPNACSLCGKPPAKDKKLLVCGRCKEVKYCNSGCQKAHWAAGHKAVCAKPKPSIVEEWAKVDEEGGINGYRKARYMEKVGAGGSAGSPVYVDGHSAMVNGVVKDIRQN